MTLQTILAAALLGIGLAMDAFSVSLANGLSDPHCRRRRVCTIAGTFAFFQALMPMIGWILVRTVAEKFVAFEKAIPFIALALLLFIGGKMIIEGVQECKCGEQVEKADVKLSLAILLVQGVATSIDALSVGFTIAEQDLLSALVSAAIIAAITFVLCFAGVRIGQRFGTRLAGRATVFGGALLVAIGIEIFLTGIL